MAIKNTAEKKIELKDIPCAGYIIFDVYDSVEKGLFKQETISDFIVGQIIRGALGTIIKDGLHKKVEEANLIEIAKTFTTKENAEEYTEDEKKYMEIYEGFMNMDHTIQLPKDIKVRDIGLNITAGAELSKWTSMFLLQLYNDFQ